MQKNNMPAAPELLENITRKILLIATNVTTITVVN